MVTKRVTHTVTHTHLHVICHSRLELGVILHAVTPPLVFSVRDDTDKGTHHYHGHPLPLDEARKVLDVAQEVAKVNVEQLRKMLGLERGGGWARKVVGGGVIGSRLRARDDPFKVTFVCTAK